MKTVAASPWLSLFRELMAHIPEDPLHGAVTETSAADAVSPSNSDYPNDTIKQISFGSVAISLLRDRSLRAAFFVFTLTRAIVLVTIVLTAQFDIEHPSPAMGEGAATLSLHKVPLARILRARVGVADSNWYRDIAVDGYTRRPFSTEKHDNWAFFPLYPLALRAAYWLTGEIPLTGIALSSLFFFIALVLLHKTAGVFGLDAAAADRTIFYIAAFPISYFFSMPLTESLFLLLTIGSFYAAKRESWVMAGVLGALASATRVTGVLLLPALAVLYWQTYRTFRPQWNFLPLLLIPSGLLSFMYYLYLITGNPFAFKDITAAWGRKPGFFLLPLLEYLRDPLVLADSWDFRALNFAAAVTALICGLVLLKRRNVSLAIYTLSCSFVTLSSGLLQSQARYAMVLFPLFMVLAIAGRRPLFDQTIRTALLIMLTLMTILFCKQIGIALS